MSMVSFRNAGRMGNFLFEAACAYGYAKKHNLQFSVPSRTNNPVWNPIYLQHLVHPEYVQGREDVLINEVWNDQQQYQEIEYKNEWFGRQIVLNGYWQSYKYFDFCRNEMIKDFAFPWELKKGLVGVHVRRGDYVTHITKHPPVTMKYLNIAIRKMVNCGYTKFKFFSDDITWCITCGVHLNFPTCEFEYSTGQTEVQDFIDMSSCESQIISNSTLSWMAAEFNRNPRKLVISPSEDNWFGKDNKHLTVKDLLRPDWFKILYTPNYIP
jgi:hypothetical protein